MCRGFNFPSLCKMKVENLEVDIYKDIYIKFIECYASKELKDIVLKWQNYGELNDEEVIYLLDGSFVKTKANFQNNLSTNSDMLETFGISLSRNDEDNTFPFDLTNAAVEEIKHEVYDSIFNNIFRDEINDILIDNFGENIRDINAYRSALDEREYIIDKACRAALKFTQFDYLFNESNNSSFSDTFIDNFSKRIKLVKLITEKAISNEEIVYIPIYDHFSNYDKKKLVEIRSKLQTIIGDTNLEVSDKSEILDSLAFQVYSIDDLHDEDNKALMEEIFKPLITKKLELDRCKELLETAENLFILAVEYNSVVDRSFYAAMFAVRALLAHFNLLGDWEVGTMSPNEKHYTLEKKLVNLMNNQSVVYSDFANDFLKIKEQRWISDYSLMKTDTSKAQDCLTIAKKLYSEVEQLI